MYYEIQSSNNVHLAHAWSVPSKYLMRLMKESSVPPNLNAIMKGPMNLPVTASYTAATTVYSPCNLFFITAFENVKKQIHH